MLAGVVLIVAFIVIMSEFMNYFKKCNVKQSCLTLSTIFATNNVISQNMGVTKSQFSL